MYLVYGTIITAIAVAVLYTFHKVRRMHLLLYQIRDEIFHCQRQTQALIKKTSDDQFHQVEALLGLTGELGLQKILPPTRFWSASPDFLRELVVHALEHRPQVIVECGSGISTIMLGRCMQLNGSGHVYTLEHAPDYAEKTRHQLTKLGLESWASVLYAPLQSVELKGEVWPWYSTEGLPKTGVDMLVIDGPPGNTRKLARYPAGPLLFGKFNPAAVAFLDDAARPDESQILREWANEFPELRQEPRYCEKGCVTLRKPPLSAAKAAAPS